MALLVGLVLLIPRLVGGATEPTVTSAIAAPATVSTDPTASAATTASPTTASPTTASPTSPSTPPSPTPLPTFSAAGDLTCTSQYCLPADADSWGSRVVAAVIEALDRDSAFSQGGVVTATSLASNATGSVLAVTVTAPDSGSTVEVWAATDPQLLPRCGDRLKASCDPGDQNHREVQIAWTGRLIEARSASGSSTIQIVVRNPKQELEINRAETYDLLADPRLRLPG